MQTHLSEQLEEINWVKELYPKAENYLSVYDKFNLVRENSIFGHCIHLSEKELEILEERNSSVAHCPTSNLFIGSGVFNLRSFHQNAVDDYQENTNAKHGRGKTRWPNYVNETIQHGRQQNQYHIYFLQQPFQKRQGNIFEQNRQDRRR